MFRRRMIALATLMAAAGLAGPANAATTTVKLHTDADVSRFLSDTGSGVTSMVKTSTDTAQRWRRTDTSAGYATYTNVKTGRCLTGRGIAGFPVVTAQACIPGALNQQWRLNTTKDFVLRLNGFAARHNTAGNGTAAIMALFNGRSDMKWHLHTV